MISGLNNIAHLDVDAFFASLEQRDDVSLRNRPVAVGTGVVASCSYEAKREGVKTGMGLAQAKTLCRSLVIVPGDHRRYEQAGRQILGICKEHSSAVEMSALDDLYMQVQAPEPCADKNHVAFLRSQILDEVGVRVSIGMGANKFLANIATHHAKMLRVRMGQKTTSPWFPGAVVLRSRGEDSPLVMVQSEHAGSYLRPWPVSLLPGVGRNGVEKFRQISVHRVGEVADMPLEVLCVLFGKRGAVLRELAHGKDDRPLCVGKPPLTVSRRSSFDPPTGDINFLLAMMDHLVERAVSWVRFQGLAARTLKVFIRYGDHQENDGGESFRVAEIREDVLRQAARQKLLSLYTRRLPLRLVGVELARLEKPLAQATLFVDPEQEKQQRLCAVRDEVRRKFGFMSIVRGTSLLLDQKLTSDRDNFRLRTPCLNR